MVDEPLDVASNCWINLAESVLAVAQGVREGPRFDVVRVSAVMSVRLCACSGESAGERREPLPNVSRVWLVVY